MICWHGSECPRWWPAEELLLSAVAEDYQRPVQQGLLLLAMDGGAEGQSEGLAGLCLLLSRLVLVMGCGGGVCLFLLPSLCQHGSPVMHLLGGIGTVSPKLHQGCWLLSRGALQDLGSRVW